ncbi:MAG: translocation/assembly module TamB domain-containing protein [Flavobacteriaceae bacterium]
MYFYTCKFKRFKRINRIKKILLRLVLGLMLLAVIISLALAIPAVQTYLASIVTKDINKSYGTDILIDRVDLSYLGKIQLKGIHIKDHHQKNMIDVVNMNTSIFSYKKAYNNKIILDDVMVNGVSITMKTYKGESNDNISIFADKFDEDTPSKGPSSFLLTAKNVHLNFGKFYLYDFNLQIEPQVFYTQLQGDLNKFKIQGPNVSAKIRNLKFVDDHKLSIKKLDTDFEYTLKSMRFKNTQIKTENSTISGTIDFDYKRENFKYFLDSVQIKAQFKNTSLSFIDLKKFYAAFDGDAKINFTSNLEGTLNNFKFTNLDLKTSTNAVLKGEFRFINSFKEVKDFVLESQIKELTSNYSQLKKLLPNLLGKNLPSSTGVLGNFSVKGNTKITDTNIFAKNEINSEIGVINFDLDIGNISSIDYASYKGRVRFKELALGKIIKDSLVGKLNMNVYVNGRGFSLNTLNTFVKGKITKHQYKGYIYRNIDIEGAFKHKKFTGKLLAYDPNLKLTIEGFADFSKKKHEYGVKTNVTYANFNALNLYLKDSISLLNGGIVFDLKGNYLDELEGQIIFKNASYTNLSGVYFFKDFKINSSFEERVRILTINSADIINGKLKGDFRLGELPDLVKNGLGSLLSKYNYKKLSPNQDLSFNFKIYNKIVEIFYPDVKLAPNTFIKGRLKTQDNSFSLNFKSPELEMYKNKIEDINLQIDNKNPLFNTLLTISKINSNYYNISKLNLVNVKLKDTLFLRTNFYGGDSLTEKYSLSMYNTKMANNQSVFGVKKSNINIKDINWVLNPTNNKANKIIFDNKFKSFKIEKIDLQSGAQKADMEGLITDANNKDIQINLENVALENITPKIDSLSLKGVINGNLNYKQINGQLMPITDMTIDNFMINKSYQGDVIFNAQGFNTFKKYELNLLINRNGIRSLYAKGAIDLTDKKPRLDIDLLFNKFKLNAFSPLGENVLSNIRGFASGEAKVLGLLENPFIEGELTLTDAGLKFPYINVDYHFKGEPKIKLYKHTFEFLPTVLVDENYKTEANLTGTIKHEHFRNWFLDLQLKTDNLLVLNTKEDEETLYYGTGFINGQASITGRTDNLLIEVNGKTNAGTKFIIPLSDVRSIDDSNLIHFINKAENINKDRAKEDVIVNDLQGLNIKFNLDVTKDAIAQIVIDKKTGSILKGSGDGNLQISINTNGNFTMFGNFVVDNGIYQFKNIINKSFEVKKGGTITWTGNPYNADLDIEAVYHTKANPAVLLENVKGTRNINVDLVTQIQGKLYESNIGFDVKIPNASSTVNAELQFKLNDNDKKMIQFFALLTTGMFINQDNSNFDSNAAITGTISERISSVLSDILNKDGGDLQIGINYDVGNTDRFKNFKTDDQLEISASARISKKFIINGKVGVPMGSKTQSNVVGEVEIAIPLNKSESLKGRIFNRQNQIQFAVADQEGYTQGVGLSYRIEFDNLKDLFKKLNKKNKKNKKDSILQTKKLLNFKSKDSTSIKLEN